MAANYWYILTRKMRRSSAIRFHPAKGAGSQAGLIASAGLLTDEHLAGTGEFVLAGTLTVADRRLTRFRDRSGNVVTHKNY